MKRREFFELAGLTGLGLPLAPAPRIAPLASRFPSPAPRDVDPLVEALSAVAEARHPGVLSDADIQELKRQVASIQQAASALRAVQLTNAVAPACVAAA